MSHKWSDQDGRWLVGFGGTCSEEASRGIARPAEEELDRVVVAGRTSWWIHYAGSEADYERTADLADEQSVGLAVRGKIAQPEQVVRGADSVSTMAHPAQVLNGRATVRTGIVAANLEGERSSARRGERGRRRTKWPLQGRIIARTETRVSCQRVCQTVCKTPCLTTCNY